MLEEGGVQLHDVADGSLFYNEHQLLQRDLSVAVLRVLRASSSDPNLTVCDALSGTGVRALRYAVECCTAKGSIKVTANDASTSAAIVANRDLNGIAAELFAVQGQDASALLLANALQFYYIDLDPFGSPMPFLAAAVTAVADHGVLAVAATDFDVISGKRARACRRLYGTNPVPNSTCPGEVALRVLLQAIATAAAEQGKLVEPLLCVGLEFCVRVFVRVHSNAASNAAAAAAAAAGTADAVADADAAVPELIWLTPADITAAGSAYTVHYSKPNSDNSEQSRNKTAAAVYGPLWGGPLYSTDFVAQVLALLTRTETDAASATATAVQPPSKLLYPLATADRIAALLSSLTQELQGVILSCSMPLLAKQLGIAHMRPSLLTVINCLNAAGHQCSLTHTDPQGFKTTAPPAVVAEAVLSAVHTTTGGALAAASAAVAKQNSSDVNNSSSNAITAQQLGDDDQIVDDNYVDQDTAQLLDTAGCGTRCTGSNAPAQCDSATVIQYIQDTTAAAALAHVHVLVVGSNAELTTALQQCSSATVQVSTDVSTLHDAVAMCDSTASVKTNSGDSNNAINSTDYNKNNDNTASCVYVLVLVGGVHTVTEQLQLAVSSMHIVGISDSDGSMPKLIGHVLCTTDSVYISNCCIMSSDDSNHAAYKRKRDDASSSNSSGNKLSQTVVVQGTGASLHLTNCSITNDGVSSGACVCAANSAHLVLDSCSISSSSGAGMFVCGKATACITASAVANM
eukprot:13306-Heterococcus_DN1.PRE.5